MSRYWIFSRDCFAIFYFYDGLGLTYLIVDWFSWAENICNTMCLLKELFSLLYKHNFLDLYLDAQINTVKDLFFCDTMSAIRDDVWPSKQRTVQPSEYVHWVSQSSLSSWENRSVRWRHMWPRYPIDTSPNLYRNTLMPHILILYGR